MAEPAGDASFHRDATFAVWILRLFLGLRTITAGLEKFESGGRYSWDNYTQTMKRMAEGITSASFLPIWLTRGYAWPLGLVLFLLGVTVLLGIKPRLSLLALGVVYTGLAFGLMAVQESPGVAWLGIYVGLIAAALYLNRYNTGKLVAD